MRRSMPGLFASGLLLVEALFLKQEPKSRRVPDVKLNVSQPLIFEYLCSAINKGSTMDIFSPDG